MQFVPLCGSDIIDELYHMELLFAVVGGLYSMASSILCGGGNIDFLFCLGLPGKLAHRPVQWQIYDMRGGCT